MKKLSTHAQAAKMIREELKKAFPETEFRVQSRTYSGGNSIDINWINGPTIDQVTDITCKYQQGHFDGYTDSYEYSNSRKDIPQVKFVFANREISEDILTEVFLKYKLSHAGWENISSIHDQSFEFKNQWRFWTPFEYIHKILQKIDLTKGYECIS